MIPIEISKIESDRVVDLLFYKNHYVLIEELHVIFGNHKKSFACKRCLNSYTSEIMLMIHKPKSENYEIFTIRTSGESHFHWHDHFHKNPGILR